MTPLFVYGTLKRGGYWNKAVFQPLRAQYHGEATLRDYALYAVNADVPALLPTEGARTHGEVWSVEDGTALAVVDELEMMYTRTPVTVEMDGHPVLVQTYLWNSVWSVSRYPMDSWPIEGIAEWREKQ